MIDVGPALDCSGVTTLFGRPYPVQFRNQGAIGAWTRALGNTEVWQRWQHPETLCWSIRQEISWQMDQMHPMGLVPAGLVEKVAANRRMLMVEISANLKYHLNKGTVIEATRALETLLTNSDVDISLPMSFVAPPFGAQYLRFGEAAMKYLKVPESLGPDHVFDGVFCFFTPDPVGRAKGEPLWTLELVFISKRHDRYNGHVALLGETDRGSTTVGEWLTGVLAAVEGKPFEEFHRPMHAAVSYVVRVLLYMALKQARVMQHAEYDEALRRAAGLGERKRAKLLKKTASMYNGILVGPESLPPAALDSGEGGGLAPHWRRGHFRMQAYGTGKQQRKLIFIAPVLIHADQLQGDVPVPKAYRAGSSVASSA